MAGAPPFFQDYSFIVYVFYVFVKRRKQPPSDLYGLAGRLIFCVSTTDILRSGASRSVLLRSGAGAVCGPRLRGRCRSAPAGSRRRFRRACRWQAVRHLAASSFPALMRGQPRPKSQSYLQGFAACHHLTCEVQPAVPRT